MTPERWRQIEELFHAAQERGTEVLVGAHPELRRQVELLLAQHGTLPALDVSTLTIVTPGTQLGPYRIEATIGEGGMGKVFRAVDTRLGRAVAIKTSTEEFGERFDREARAISALNHPHICTLYDVGPNYLVMELCEGETLAARIRKGKLSIDDTLRYGSQIAAALAAAHAKGITHRDLKPANIMLTKPGVKVLDFGIAKSAGDETLTASRVAIGTPAYMSPEQRKAQDVDHRCDIYALGLVLYEMAAGKRPPQDSPAQFDGLPAQFAHVIERCLDQDPAERWQDANDVRKELEWAAKAPIPIAVAPKRRPVIWWIVAALASAATLAGFLWLRPNASRREPVEFTFTSPPDAVMTREIAVVSPDGRAIAFTTRDPSGQSFVWVRTLDSPVARKLAGTEQASRPFWSPDGRYIAFFASNKLKKIGITSGPSQTICTTLPGLGGAWSPSGDIVFNPRNRAPLSRVSAAGGTPAAITTLEAKRQENSHRWPSFLPDGHHFLFTVRSSLKENTGIYIGSLDSKETKRILAEQSNAVYAPPGYLVFSREGSVMVQPFNLSKMEVAGEAVPVASGIDQETPSASGFFSVSADGTTLAYAQVDHPVDQLTWIDRTGSHQEPFGPVGRYSQPRLSPDGKRLAYASNDSDSGNRDIWLMDLSTTARIRLTSNPANDWWPVWSPDGAEIAFASDRKPRSSLYRKRADGSGEEELLLFPEGKGGAFNPDWSPDARSLAYDQENPDTRGLDLWLLPLTGERKPQPLLVTDFSESTPRFSPDGKWIAYTSNESGAPEVYLRQVNQPAKLRISTNGGSNPVWRRDGKELFYVAPGGGTIMAADIQLGETPKISQPKVLFRGCSADGSSQVFPEYDVTSDGKRFIFSCFAEGTNRQSLTVAIGWI